MNIFPSSQSYCSRNIINFNLSQWYISLKISKCKYFLLFYRKIFAGFSKPPHKMNMDADRYCWCNRKHLWLVSRDDGCVIWRSAGGSRAAEHVMTTRARSNSPARCSSARGETEGASGQWEHFRVTWIHRHSMLTHRGPWRAGLTCLLYFLIAGNFYGSFGSFCILHI